MMLPTTCASLFWLGLNARDRVAKILRNRTGATAAEYALVLALVAVILIGSLTRLGQALIIQLENIIDRISDVG